MSVVPDAPRPRELRAADYGVRGDGVTDDREPLQAAIDAAAASPTGGIVTMRPGVFVIGQAGRAYHGILLPGGVTLRGEGPDTILSQSLLVAPSVRLIKVTGRGNGLIGLTLDGNAPTMPANDHRAGVFAMDCDLLVMRSVSARNFTGDGFYFYNGAQDVAITDCEASWNTRNGITMGGAVEGMLIDRSRIFSNAAQQIDSEPGGDAMVRDVRIRDSVIDVGDSGDWAITASGVAGANPGRGWEIRGNVINGGIFVVWADDVTIAGNRGRNPTDKPCVKIQRSSARARVLGNDLVAERSVAAIDIEGTGGSGPEDARIVGNRLTTRNVAGFGVRAAGAVSVTVAGNDIRGPGPLVGSAGVYVRATVEDRDFERATIVDNDVSNFSVGVLTAGNGAARLVALEVRRNLFTTVPTAMREGIAAIGDNIGDNVSRVGP